MKHYAIKAVRGIHPGLKGACLHLRLHAGQKGRGKWIMSHTCLNNATDYNRCVYEMMVAAIGMGVRPSFTRNMGPYAIHPNTSFLLGKKEEQAFA